MNPLNLSSLSDSCVKCGKCVPQCTIYRVTREEVTSPRGYLDLVGAYARGDLELELNVKNFLESCFLCTTCVEACPTHLPVDRAIEKIRVEIAKQYGIAWYKRIYFYLLRHRKLMDFVFSFVDFIAPCVFQKTASNDNKIRFFTNRVVFPFQKKSFLQKHSGKRSEIHNQKTPYTPNLAHKKVAIFIGCLANYNYINVGESLLEVLAYLGIDVLIPKQECCGAPAYFTGDIRTTTTLIKKNIQYFEGFIDEVDAILIPEATCAAMLMSDWAHALSEEAESSLRNSWIERLNKLTPKMNMASAWLYHNTNLAQILKTKGTNPATLTYHDPCHAKKVLKIHKEPRALLTQNYHITEMSEPDRCCGFGGVSMQADRYNLTLKAGAPKAQMIKESGAQIVSAECSACRMQITNSLHQANAKASFIHPLELIAKSLKEKLR